MFKCNLCKQEFKTKRILEQHINKKNKCDSVTDFKCKKCNKYFKFNKNLKEHEEKNICKIIFNNIQKKDNKEIKEIEKIEGIDNNMNDKKISIKIILKNTKFNDDNKIDLLNKMNIKLSKEELKLILNNSDMNIDEKVMIINQLSNNCDKPKETVNNIQIINNTTNNTTNNIQINNFGNEKIDYLDNEYFKDLILNNHIQEAYKKLIFDIYLHKDHPENHTIKNTNQYGANAYVYENGKWRSIVKYELKEIMHEKNNKLLKIHYQRLKEFINKAKDSSIRVFFTRKFNADPYLIHVNKEMILFFYKGKDKV